MSRLFSPFYFLFDLACAAVDRAMHLDFGDLEDDEPECGHPFWEWHESGDFDVTCLSCGLRDTFPGDTDA